MLPPVDVLRRRIADSVAAFGSVFRNANLRRLELAWAASVVGNWAYLVAVSVYAYGVGGEAAVGLILFLRLVPAALIAPFAGLLGDRYRRERVLLVTNLLRVVLIGAAAVQVNVFVNSNFASYLGNGPVSWLNVAFRFMQLPIGLFGVAIGTVALPRLARHVAAGDTTGLRRTLRESLELERDRALWRRVPHGVLQQVLKSRSKPFFISSDVFLLKEVNFKVDVLCFCHWPDRLYELHNQLCRGYPFSHRKRFIPIQFG